MLTFKFGTALISPFVRMDDQSFHFRIIEADLGETYILESAPFLGSEWKAVTEFVAVQTEIQLQVEYPHDATARFFRVRSPRN